MRSNAVGGGGGVLYFKLGVGRCSYDASTEVYMIDIWKHIYKPVLKLYFTAHGITKYLSEFGPRLLE
jgi:hypothetical protein